MKTLKSKFVLNDSDEISYKEIASNKPMLLMIHAQGVNSDSFDRVAKSLSKQYHILAVDCYGHGDSSKDADKYTLSAIGDDLAELVKSKTDDKVTILGHSSGGLIAAYMAAKTDVCNNLILEDAPLFSCEGDRRFNTYNYVDLSTACHNYLNQSEEKDFVYYYFANQYCWNFFPEDKRDNIRGKLCEFARKFREKNPQDNLRVPFWPKKFLAGFEGLQDYDPRFGEAFYNDSFNNISHEEILANIHCPTLIMKANTTIGDNGLLQGAMSDADLIKAKTLIKGADVQVFDCGHAIHNDKANAFVKAVASRAQENEQNLVPEMDR